MNAYIIDASVILNSLLHPKDSVDRQFQKLFQEQKKKEIQLYSIPMVQMEIANGLRFALTDEKSAQNAFREYTNLPLEYVQQTNAHIEAALCWSYNYKTTVYDSIYHVTAKMLDATFLTCDNQYYQKAKSAGNIKLLR